MVRSCFAGGLPQWRATSAQNPKKGDLLYTVENTIRVEKCANTCRHGPLGSNEPCDRQVLWLHAPRCATSRRYLSSAIASAEGTRSTSKNHCTSTHARCCATCMFWACPATIRSTPRSGCSAYLTDTCTLAVASLVRQMPAQHSKDAPGTPLFLELGALEPAA